MVFVKPTDLPTGNDCKNCKDLSVVTIRNTGKYASLLVLESMFGLTVALSNAILIVILVLGWRKLMKNKFYVVLSNLIACTSLKGFVELGFIVPYYVMQSDGEKRTPGYFSALYERIVFNVSVLADHGVLFFSVLIAVNRLVTVTMSPENSRTQRHSHGVKTALSCALVWACAAVIPVLFFIFDCQYVYDDKRFIYRNTCARPHDELMLALLNCLIYLTYACAALVLVLYLFILRALRRQHVISHYNGQKSTLPGAQMLLLKQSVVVFAFYAASIICVFAMSFVQPDVDFGTFDIAYVENLLNMSIAAVYPICFLTMSGEMKSILVANFLSRRTSSTIRLSANNNRITKNEISTKH